MSNSPQVNLTKRVKINAGMRYLPVVISPNGRVKPDYVILEGQETRIEGGSYYLDWTDPQTSKRIRKSVGSSAASALAQQQRKATELKAQAQGISLVTPEELGKRHLLTTAIANYMEEIALSKKPKTFAAYGTALQYFQESCSKSYVEEIERMDMIRFSAFLRDKKNQAPRSVANKFEYVMIFLKAQGVTGLIRRGDWPKYVEEDVEVYEKDELSVFFASCEPSERRWFEFFLMTGMREQEVIYMTWRNVRPDQGIVSMRWNPEFKWRPKGYKEREIPVPKKLLDSLEKVRPVNVSGKTLLFPTSSGKPKFDFLDCCKSVAKRAGLGEEGWYLHKFRATFATWHLQAGVDLRTVQAWMGHVDLESTLRYLKPARSEQAQERVNVTFS